MLHVQSVLCDNGFEQEWLFRCGNDTFFVKEQKERLYSSFFHIWYNHLESSQRLSLYNNYKDCFKREKYVDVLWRDVYRNALAQFRIGVYQIKVHRHRF